MKKEAVNTDELQRKQALRVERKGEAIKNAAPLDTAAPDEGAPRIFEGIEAASRTPIDTAPLMALAPKPKQEYAPAGASLYSDLTGKRALSREEGEKVSTQLRRIAQEGKSALFAVNERDEMYSTLTAYEKAVIIALRVLLSDSTAERHALIEAARKTDKKQYSGRSIDKYEGIDFTGAFNIRIAAYSRYLKEAQGQALNDEEKRIIYRPGEAELLGLGFTPSDLVVVFEKNSFITDYLGGTKSSKQGAALEAAIARLSSGKVYLMNSKHFISTTLIQRTATFGGLKKGQKVTYYVLSLHPQFGRIFTPNYITYPANNSEIIGAILSSRKQAGGLLDLYDVLLQKAAQNFEKINARPKVQVFTLPEDLIIRLLVNEREYKKNKKRALEAIYSDTGINLFYKAGLLATEVLPPTEAQRKQAAAAGLPVDVGIHFNRVAATNC